MGVNKVMLLGNLGKDPELRYTQNQTAVCTFSLATGDRRKDATGNWVDHTEWHNIVVWGKTAEHCNTYLKKGRQAFIEGRIQTRKWQDKEGKDRYTTEIVANTVQFVGGGKGEGRGESQPEMIVEDSEPRSAKAAAPMAANGGGAATFEDDDIPF